MLCYVMLCYRSDIYYCFQAIGSRNLLKSVAQQRQAQQQELQALITEKKIQLERLGSNMQIMWAI